MNTLRNVACIAIGVVSSLLSLPVQAQLKTELLPGVYAYYGPTGELCPRKFTVDQNGIAIFEPISTSLPAKPSKLKRMARNFAQNYAASNAQHSSGDYNPALMQMAQHQSLQPLQFTPMQSMMPTNYYSPTNGAGQVIPTGGNSYTLTGPLFNR